MFDIRNLISIGTLAILALGSVAISNTAQAGWDEFTTAFPTYPCHDGWVACLVDGEKVDPALAKDTTGSPFPSDLRVGWFDLKPTDSFSPFVELSAYTGVLPKQVEEPVVADGDDDDDDNSDDDDDDDHVSAGDDDDHVAAGDDDDHVAAGDDDDDAVAVAPDPDPVQPDPADPEPKVDPEPSGSVRPKDNDATASQGDDDDDDTTENVIAVRPKPEPEVVDDSCDNLVKLEPAAMLGRLSGGQIACLEASFAAAAKQTEKEKISLVLMANAYSSGDRATWEKLVKRHLDEVDQSNPDLCYKYALHLAKKGPSRSHGVIKWADVALENRTVWTGVTYQSRVTTLYKLKAAAGQKLWKQAEEKHAATNTDETRKMAEEARNMTKVYAREWYEYAKVAGKDTTSALQLCISAAGTRDYCEAG